MNPDTRAGVVAHSWHPNFSSSYVLFTPVDLVREIYLRYARRDRAGVFALLTADVEFAQTAELPWGGHHAGQEGAWKYRLRLNKYTDAALEPFNYVAAGEDVAVMGKFRGAVRATGKVFEVELVQIWTVDRGKVRRCETFMDTPALRAVLAARERAGGDVFWSAVVLRDEGRGAPAQ